MLVDLNWTSIIICRQICLAEFAYSHYPCLSLYVCYLLCKPGFPGCWNSEKSPIWNRTFLVEWRKACFSPPWPWPSFSIQTFGVLLVLPIFRKWWEIEQTLLLPLNGATAMLYEVCAVEYVLRTYRQLVIYLIQLISSFFITSLPTRTMCCTDYCLLYLVQPNITTYEAWHIIGNCLRTRHS